jgi:hypothetical protein
MKLSPPASSSDLDAAREIALRLHQRRRRGDRPGTDAAGTTPPATAARRPSAPAPMASPPAPPREAPEHLPWDEPAGQASRAAGAGVGPLADFGEPAAPEAVGDGAMADLEGPGVSPEEMVGDVAPPLEDLPEPEASLPSPFDDELDDLGAPAEEVVDSPAPPSWDDLVESCLGLARATGAMLVDPAGQVLAARGVWPTPGPDAIAAKLVATMDRTLRDAPTRSISAPLVGKHLTAWRVPLAEGLVTAAFIGDSPVRADARPAIDTEIHRGVGA